MESEHEKNVQAVFDKVSADYDNPTTRFFLSSAEKMIELLDLRGEEQFLDVATGTGNVALQASTKLVNGKVIGVDISSRMLEIAKRKAERENRNNISFHSCGVAGMPFDDAAFDVATCSFGVFFFEDMLEGIKSIIKKVKPGGRFTFSAFAEKFMDPMRSEFFSLLEKYGVEIPPQPWQQVNTREKIQRLFDKFDHNSTQVVSCQHGYFLDGPEQWWEILTKTAMRNMIDQLDSPARERFKREHLQAIEEFVTDKGLWLNVEVLYAIIAL